MTFGDKMKPAFPVQFYRAVRVALHLLAGCFEVAVFFPIDGKSRRSRAVSRWSGQLLAILNVQPSLRGAPPMIADRAAVLVANHVSWLAIQLIHSVCPVRFIAKSEVRRWPLIGWLSAHTGTPFIERATTRHPARLNPSIHPAFHHTPAPPPFP